MAQEKTFRAVQVRSSEIGVRTIGLNDLWQSLKEGYDDFNAMPTIGVFLTIIYPLFALLLTLSGQVSHDRLLIGTEQGGQL